MIIRETIWGQFGDNYGTESLFILFFPVETNALQCYHCGTDPAVQKPILLGALTRDPSYDYTGDNWGTILH
jgi:hypothetical protein